MQKSKLIFICVALALASCSQIQTRKDIDGSARAKSNQPTRDDFSNSDNSDQRTAPPPIIQAQAENKVALILGPGGYKAFSHVGVLKELKKNNIPIHKIVGVEWGSLVAAIYAQRGQVNEVEWKLYKLEKANLNSKSFFSSRTETKDISILSDYLKENLAQMNSHETKIPFFCPSLSLSRGALSWQDSGANYQDVSNCLPSPPLLKTNKNWVAALFSYEDIVQRLKNEGYNVIILVNVLGDGALFKNSSEDISTTILWSEVRRELWRSRNFASDVINVNTKGMYFSDFESRKQFVTAGEAAGEKAARQLATKYGF